MSNEKSGGSKDELSFQELAKALPRLTPGQIAEVSPKFVRRTYSQGDEIIKQGDSADAFYIVIRGQAEIWHKDVSGHWRHIDQRKVGEYFGEIGLLQERPRTATVRAPEEGEVEVLALSHDDFKELIDESRATEAHVARDMINRLIKIANIQP